MMQAVGMGLSLLGGLSAAQGQAAGYRHAEAQAQRRELAARTAADQTDAALRDELTTTLGNIRAIRAAAGVLPDSPTGIALEDREREVSDRQRTIRVSNLITQANQFADDAAFYRYAAGSALQSGYLSAFGKGISGLSSLIGSGFGGK